MLRRDDDPSREGGSGWVWAVCPPASPQSLSSSGLGSWFQGPHGFWSVVSWKPLRSYPVPVGLLVSKLQSQCIVRRGLGYMVGWGHLPEQMWRHDQSQASYQPCCVLFPENTEGQTETCTTYSKVSTYFSHLKHSLKMRRARACQQSGACVLWASHWSQWGRVPTNPLSPSSLL